MNTNELKEFWQGFPEAPFSDTFKWVDADGYEHLFTARGWGGDALMGAVTKAKEFIAAAGGKPPVARSGPAVSVPVPVSEHPEGMPEGIELRSDAFDYFVVKPEPDSRATVEFWREGRKYAEHIVSKWKNAAVVDLLAPIKVVDPLKAETHRHPGVAYWSEGNEYTGKDGSKRHYKDVRAVKSA